MHSDEKTTITTPAEAAWAAGQHDRVVDYLASQAAKHAGVSLEPRWFLHPYVAIWSVRSNERPDRIGWWAISGDLPTDYLTCANEQENADVLLSFSRRWKAAAEQMATGVQPSGYCIGPPGLEKELAPLLLTRAQLLEDFANDIKAGVGGSSD